MDHIQIHIDWLRSLQPADVAGQTLEKLRQGVPEDELWAAGALTACRYINNQAHNLLGFVSHALIGCEDARRLAASQETPIRTALLIQALHQVVADMHDPCMSPYVLLPFSPFREATLEENIRMLRLDARTGEVSRCDHRFVALEADLDRSELLDLLFDIGLEGVITDEHTIITPSLVIGLCDLVGWEQGFDMLRCALRYSASFTRNFAPYDRAVELAERFGLTNGAPVSDYQPERIESLRQILHHSDPESRPEVITHVMAEDGYSPQTILAAVSLTACDFYLMAEPVPHADYDAISREVSPIHIGTGTNALRDSLRYMSPRTQVLAAIQGGGLLERGPNILSPDFEFVRFQPGIAYPYPQDVARLASKSPEQCLDILLSALPAHDYRTATAAVRVYADVGGEPETLISALISVACTDNGTLMHNIKHLNSMVEELYSLEHPDRWNYLIAAARFMAWYAGVTPDVYHQTQAVMQ